MTETVRDAAFQELLDKQAIREVVMRYARGADRCDAALLSSAYFPDATEERPGVSYGGEHFGENMVKMLSETMRSTSHQIGTQLIEVRGEAAVAESYSTGRHVLKDGKRLHTTVRYLDRFEKRAGEWRITHRKVITDATEVLPATEDLVPSLGSRDRNDPSYQLFAL
jgi:ketosteroid isomerase-like protein